MVPMRTKRENIRPNEKRTPQPGQWFLLEGHILLMVRRRLGDDAVVYDSLDRRTWTRTRANGATLSEWRRLVGNAKPASRYVRMRGDVAEVKCVDGLWRVYCNADVVDLDERPPTSQHCFCPRCGPDVGGGVPRGAAYAEMRGYDPMSLRMCDECRMDAVMQHVTELEEETGLKFTSSPPRHLQLRGKGAAKIYKPMPSSRYGGSGYESDKHGEIWRCDY